MQRTVSHLADGREIIYFDGPGAPLRTASDGRPLTPTITTSELRHDPILDEWVVMASHRQGRTHLPPVDECPLCPSRDGADTEIPEKSYDVVVFENRFPSLSGEAGRCEVVCFTDDHDASFAALDQAQARLVIDAWADRTATLGERPEVEQVFCFENRGQEIGVTLDHPHGQIYAYPYLPPRTAQMLSSAQRHHAATGRNLFADVLAAERDEGVRVVAESEHWTAFVPRAARWPAEVHLYPHRRRVADLTDLTDAERDDLAASYLHLLRTFDGLYEQPMPYIAAWHQAPRAGRELWYLHLQLFSIKRAADKLKYLAGSESALGAFITDVLPEDVAVRLRDVAP